MLSCARVPKSVIASSDAMQSLHHSDSLMLFDSVLIVIDGDKVYKEHTRTTYNLRKSDKEQAVRTEAVRQDQSHHGWRWWLVIAVIVLAVIVLVVVTLWVVRCLRLLYR